MRLRLLLLTALAGCLILSPGELRVTASADESVASVEEGVTVLVTAENVGGDRVDWGEGSSTCQLDLLVRVDGRDRLALLNRVCTSDLATHDLEPGESRTEGLTWHGSIRPMEGSDSSVERLGPGTYQVRGAAGRVAASPPVTVTLEPAG